jgi:hypothetical protein
MSRRKTQTIATHNSGHSQYQADSISGLPSATSWPNDATVPCQARLNYDLLGLSCQPRAVDYPCYAVKAQSRQSTECPYHRTTLQADFAGGGSAGGLGGIDRFIAKAPSPSDHSAVDFRGDMFYQTREYFCLGAWQTDTFSLVGFDDEELVVQ